MLPEELHRIARAADAARALGAEHLVVGGGARPRRPLPPAPVGDRRDAREGAKDPRPHRNRLYPDTAHLAAAGGDPAAMVLEHADRIAYVRLEGRREPFAFTPVGTGECDNAAVIRALGEIGHAGWVCNELDAWPDPADGARQSRASVEREMARL